MKSKDKTHKYNTRSKKRVEDKKHKRRRNESSDDSDSDSDNDSREDELNIKDYQNMLSRIFPSKYMQSKTGGSSKSSKYDDPKETIKTLKMIRKFYQKENNKHMVKDCDLAIKEMQKKKKSKKESNTSETSDSDYETSNNSSSEEEGDSSDNDDDEDEESDDESGDESADESDEEDAEIILDNGAKFNIIFTMGNNEIDDEYNADDETETDAESECESNSERNSTSDTESDNSNTKINKLDDNEVINKFQTMAKELLKQDKNNKVLKNIDSDIKDRERIVNKKKYKKERKAKLKNTGSFRKLLSNKNVLNDVNFFENKLSIEEQEKVLTEMKAIKKHTTTDKPYRLKLLDSDIPTIFKATAFKKINSLRYMEPGSGEYHKIRTWVDTFMQIPFGMYRSLPLSIADGTDKCSEYMENAKATLDKCVYGLNDAKLQILQFAGQWITNPNALGSAIGIYGPPGTGKTTLVKEGISKILGRDYAFCTLGGTSDGTKFKGHSYTYEGATWGKIVETLVQSGSMNPIIYFDELDKVSDTPKGEEIIGILTHLTDTTQNDKFHDDYFAELDFDLSKCLFIFSYNDAAKVNSMYPVLKDRMYRIETKGYKAKEKVTIANDYLLPKIRDQVKFEEGNITIEDTVLEYIIEKYTEKEEGVRNLKRCLEIIHTKLNLYRLIKPGTNLFGEEKVMEIKFPMTVTKEIVDKLIKLNDKNGQPPSGMYI